MAYLTEHTYSKLCKNLKLNNTNINLNFFLKHIYNDKEIYDMLNKFDISYLYKYKSLLNDEYLLKLKHFYNFHTNFPYFEYKY